MIKFIEKESVEKESAEILCFDEVPRGQFFIDSFGNLCQQDDHQSYFILCHPDGRPCGHGRHDFFPDTPIKKILHIKKIEFGGNEND